MKIILTLLLSLFSVSILSQNIYQIHHSIVPGVSGKEIGETYYGQYFVDATNGNDSYTGTNTDSAWQTISKISGNVSSGDTISFKCGETWRETLTVPDDSLTFMSYGSGDKPKILGSDVDSTWDNRSGNIWATGTYTNPFVGYDKNIFFVETDNSVTWGDSVVSIGDLIQEYDWVWQNDSIYVYCESDPGTAYTTVEIAQRDENIDLNSKDYIEINGFGLFYGLAGIRGEHPVVGRIGLIVRNCNMAYFGQKDGEEGFGIHACYNNALFEYDTIYECGRRGISVRNYGDADISNMVCQYCEFYNGYHTTGFDVRAGSGGSDDGDIDSIIIRYNYIHDAIDDAGSRCEYIWLQGPGSGTGTLNRIYVYNNIMFYSSNHGIGIDEVNNLYIYNNTFYGHNSTKTSNTFQFSVGGGSTNIFVKNNIFYTLLDNSSNDRGEGAHVNSGQDHTEVDADYNLYYRITTSLRLLRVEDVGYYTTDSWAAMKAALGWETNSPYPADPTFTNPPDNLHLQTGSPAIDAGLAIDFITTDYEGVERGDPPCIGAFETIED